MWSIANTALSVESTSGSIVYNRRWQELVKDENERQQRLQNYNTANRVVVHTYENERFILGFGWSSHNLLPTDRPAWTNVNGSIEIPKSSVVLPSDDWEWEFDWQLVCFCLLCTDLFHLCAGFRCSSSR